LAGSVWYRLIDTGAQVSLIPASASDRRNAASTTCQSSPLQLSAANGSRIPSYGTRASRVSIGDRLFSVTLVIADVRRPILGADFLRRHNLLVDVFGQRLIDARSFKSYTHGVDACFSSETPVATVSENAFANILMNDFPKLLQPTFNLAQPAHGQQEI
jgi:hypothetical protein